MMFTPNTNNKNGFTLAEVLITLTIIGVIAALTIPNLMQRYQEHATVNKVKKFYSTLTNAYTQTVKEYGTFDEAWTYETVYKNVFEPYFKIHKTCKNDFCGYNTSLLEVIGTGAWNHLNNKSFTYTVVLDDGTSVWIENNGQIYFNLAKTKQERPVWGKTFFLFVIADNKVYPNGLQPGSKVDCYPRQSRGKADTCAAWIIYKGNMDYLHCDDLTWNGKNKCSK